MSKHIPGPWSYTPLAKGMRISADTKTSLALVLVPQYYDSEKEAQLANARLIASAPELLEALEEVLELMGEIDATTREDDDGNEVFYHEVQAAYDAIAKAKGNQ